MTRLAVVSGWIVLVLAAGPARAQRPIYVIAHRVNDVSRIDEALGLGANALECDIRFWRPGGRMEFVVDHDGVFPSSTKLRDWLDGAKKAAAKHKHFALIYFDMKVSKIDDNAPPELLRQARAALPADLALIFSTSNYDKRSFFNKVKGQLGKRDGLAIDEEKGAARVQQYFAKELKVNNFWYGYGTFAAGVARVEPSLRDAVKLRDQGGGTKKVCVWTLERHSSIEKYIKDIHVDALIVNVKHSLPLHSSPVPSAVRLAKKYGRLATRADDPFAVHK